MLISVLSLMVALAALFLGPFFAHRKTVAEMRQAWINQLRDLVAELLSLSTGPEVTQFTRDRDVDASMEPYSRLFLLENKMELLLNPDREQHRILIGRVHDLISLLHKSESFQKISSSIARQISNSRSRPRRSRSSVASGHALETLYDEA